VNAHDTAPWPVPGRERRRHRRFGISLPVRELAPEEHVMRATSISAGGLFCPDAAPRRAGTELTLELELGEDRPTTLKARVVHKARAGFGLGLEFTEPAPALEAYLRRLVPAWDDTTSPWYLSGRND
jgi:hypothetical protein